MKAILTLFLFSIGAYASVSPSILLFNVWDFNDCSNRVNKAIDIGAKTVNIVPTIHFLAQNNNDVEYFCYQKSFCDKLLPNVVAQVKKDLKVCAETAAKNGLNISFVPHVDDGGGRGIWRNNLVFDPLKVYGNTSYKEAILDPILEIIQSLQSYPIEIDYAFQGEMGATVFNFPKSYKDIIAEYRNKTKNSIAKIRFGLSINYNELGGVGHKHNNRKSKRVIKRLFNSLDFLGFSFYHPVERKLDKHFDFAKKKFLWELRKKGIKLKDSLPLHFTEIGLGGGSRRNDGATPGKNPRQIGSAPYAGLYSSYDPMTSPWENRENSNFRRTFYEELFKFMNSPQESNPVTHAFVWNADSWDVFGIYPGTEGYSDPQIIDFIYKNNSLAR